MLHYRLVFEDRVHYLHGSVVDAPEVGEGTETDLSEDTVQKLQGQHVQRLEVVLWNDSVSSII